MLFLDYFHFLTVACLILSSATPSIADTDPDSLGLLASYNDSEDPDRLLDGGATTSTSNPYTAERPTGHVPVIKSHDPEESHDDFYIDEDEDDEGAIDTEDDEGEVLNWVQNAVGSGIFDDVEYNQAILSRIPHEHSLVYPVQIRKNEVLGLDTHDQDRTKPGLHYYHTNLLFRMDSKKYKLKLSLNKDLISREMKQKTNIDTKTQIIEEGDLENCFYHGQVRKLQKSKVIINTCNGISGVILLDNTTYAIQPLKPLVSSNETRWPHVMYKLPLTPSMHKSANSRGMWKSFRELHVGEFMRRRKIMTAMKNEFDVLGVTKRLQLGLIADYSVLQRSNMSVNSALVYLGQIANILDAVLQEVNIRVTLKYVELWNCGDLVSVERNARATLHNVFTYRQNALSFVDVDILHLLSGQRFDNEEIGMAIPDSICTHRAVSVSYDVSDFDRLKTANGVLHMIGHQFGLTEESTETCPCPYSTGCVMSVIANASISDHALGFSPCAKISLEEALLGGLGTCMLENPPRFLSYSQHQEVFTQSCGNGRVERGEECDCLSPQECHLMDPCCNPDTCLLQPWATCRFGECCENCTVVPANYMCRLSKSECDVAEFCDGASGYCPNNVTVQDGWPCKDGDGFCYQGLCQTYTDQCRNIWGPDARQADSKCYETFNTAGRFNGHCGTNNTSEEYVKCDKHDVSCGLLHCEGGTTEPSIGKDNVFSTTTVNLAGVNYECKIISSHMVSELPHYGMVQDGTKCDNNSICINRHCVSLETVTSGTCPLGDNNIVCSGNGVCTNELTCYCNVNYTGHDCSQFRVHTTIIQPRLITSLMSELERQTAPPPPAQVNMTSSSTTAHSTTVESPVLSKAERSVSTIWLIIVLSSVAGGALLVLGCCMICYRRKSTVTFKKKTKKKKKNPSIFGSLTSFSSGNSKSSRSKEESGDEVTNRIISFGNMPSYRADKIKKVMRQSAGSDTEHNTSASNRSSAEVKVVHTLPLAKAPERGILKKYPRTDAEHQNSQRRSRTPLCSSASGAGKEMENLRGSSAGGSTENDPMIPLSTLMHNYEEISDVECALDDDCLSCCSCDDDNEKVDDDDDKAGDDEPCDCCSDNRDQQTQTDPDSPQRETPVEFPTSFDSLEGAKSKIVKLRNINELLKQIDAQFTNVLRESAQSGEDSTQAHEDTSPAGSGSEPEADRHCFYSPPSSAHYSGSGENGTSPTALPSPIQPVQPAVPPPAAHYRDPLRGPRHTTSTPKSTPPPQEHTGKAPDKKDPGLATKKSEEHLARHDSTWRSSPTRTQRDSPTRCSPIQRDSPPRMGSPSVSRIPDCPTRPAPELSSKKKSPEHGISSKYSPKMAPQSAKTASRNLNNSSNSKDSCHKVEPPPVIAVPYRGAKSGSPTPQARKRFDHCTPPGSPKFSASGRASPNSRSLGSSSKSEPSPTTKLVLGNPSGSNNTSNGSGSGSNGSSSTVPTPTDRQESPSVDKTKLTSTGSDGKPNRSLHPAKPSTSLLSKLTQPLFDSKAFRRRGSHSIDGTSNSEGYHSDRADLDNEDAVIVREIPGKKPADLPFMPNPNGSYTRAPGSPGSPEDINV